MEQTAEISVFVRTVETGNFSTAGRALRLTPSAVSKQIGRLEQRLGTRLFNRTTRKLNLTEAGRVFYERCRRLLADLEEAEREVAQLQATPIGTLRVTATTTFSKRQVVPLIPEFLERFPGIRIELELDDRRMDLVAEGFDVAIRRGDLGDSSLVARKLCVNRRVICAAPAYLKRLGAPEVPEDLASHNCLTLSASEPFNDWNFGGPEGSKVLRVSGNFEVNHTDALYEAVLAGIGVARLATFVVGPDIKAGRLVPLLTDYVQEQSAIYAVYPHRRYLSPKVRAFVDFLVEKIASSPPWEVALSTSVKVDPIRTDKT